MQLLLAQFYLVYEASPADVDAAELLRELVDKVRPPRKLKHEQASAYASNALRALCHLLQTHLGYQAMLRHALLRLIGECKAVSLYADTGIQPSTGFFSEMANRVGRKFLPEVKHPQYLNDVFALVFHQQNDALWVEHVPDEVWYALLDVLGFYQGLPTLLTSSYAQLLESIQVLSYRLVASGLEPMLIRNHPELENHHSPFLAQNIELQRILDVDAASSEVLVAGVEDGLSAISHVLVMLQQCQDVIAKIRRASMQTGTSIALTFLLQRMRQQIVRMQILLQIADACAKQQSVQVEVVSLFKQLVFAECHKNDIRMHWRENMELMALRVTENASRTGEHYITETRSEYFALMRSAMGAGIIISLMAMLKLWIGAQHFAPLAEAILFSLNYGLGFVIIHVLHFTVATKQPAMTAAAIAASIGENDGQRDKKGRNLDKLVGLIAQTMRSQTVAILGNVVVAVPVAILLAWIFSLCTGHHYIGVEKAHKLLADLDPVHSGSLIFAAIAGVCLFLSGLIAGYHDNMAVYHQIPQRLMALNWLEKCLGKTKLRSFAYYIENNLGALAGNFYFGCLLGGMSGLGVLLGLPIDIRHIAFASAFVGFSSFALDFHMALNLLLFAVLGVLLIGTVNLLVSFTLALYVAMKSRKLSFLQWGDLFKALLKALWQQPRSFVLPPKPAAAPNQDSAQTGH